MLPADEWLAQAEELPLGRRRRVNHICGGGRTLVVEHKPEGYSAWCFRCSEKGWHSHPQPSLHERIKRLTDERAADTSAEASAAPPKPTSFNPSDWPLTARVWLYKAGFSNDAIQRHGFYYAAQLDRVVLPVIRGGRVVYWQARGFHPDRAKYLNPPIDKPLVFYGGGQLVLCEDILSAARLGEVVRGCAILGTSLSDAGVSEVLRSAHGGPVALWFDPDAAGRKATRKVAHQLALVGVPTRRISSPLDPKLYPRNTLEEFIQSALR